MLGDPARADNMTEHFASLLYRVVAGRNCPIAASLSTQAYVAIPGLSEQSNRILAMVIARQVEDSSCGKVLREVLNAEGISPRVSDHLSAGFTTRPGSSTVSPLATPPSAPVDRTPAAVRAWKAPTVSTPTPTPVVAKPVPLTVLVTPPPPAVPSPVATPAVARQSPATEPAPKLPVLPQAKPVAQPPSLPKEPAPSVAEVKTDSPRVILPKIVKPEIAPEPVEARAKAPTPEKLSAIVETRPKEASLPVARQERKIEELKKPPGMPPTPPKPRDELPVAAETKISPPPVEKPGFIAPKILPVPLPEVPIVRETVPTEISEETEPWDLRKLKPIGIGIAALLVLSVSSYLGVRAMTTSSRKSHPAEPQPSLSAPPQIARAPETAAPALTNPPSALEAVQNAAPSTQDAIKLDVALKQTLPEQPSLPDGAHNAAAPPNQDTVKLDAALKQNAPEQSMPHAQPAQPQIAPKSEQENASNASRRTRSGDTGARSASSGQAGAGHSTARSSAPANAPPPASARSAPHAPAAPKATTERRTQTNENKPSQPFKGTNPGG